MAAPLRWMEWISEFGGTATAGPNFSYALAARALKRAEGLDLSTWRLALERRRARRAAHRARLRRGGRVGSACLRGPCSRPSAWPSSPSPARSRFREPGCASTPSTRTMIEREPVRASGRRSACRRRTVLRAARHARSRASRSASPTPRPVPTARTRGRRARDPRHVGDARLLQAPRRHERRPSATTGCAPATSPTSSTVSSSCAVASRTSSSSAAATCFPRTSSAPPRDVDGVRAGNVIAFGVTNGRGHERLVVVAETKSDDLAPLRAEVARRVRESVGLPTDEVVLVGPGTLPKTSSGKLQRSLCRTRYLDEELVPV